MLKTSQFVPCDAIILCDSIGQEISAKVIRSECDFFKGCKIGRLTRKLKERDIKFFGYKCVTLIIGTSDISSIETWKSCLRTGKLLEHTLKPIP